MGDRGLFGLGACYVAIFSMYTKMWGWETYMYLEITCDDYALLAPTTLPLVSCLFSNRLIESNQMLNDLLTCTRGRHTRGAYENTFILLPATRGLVSCQKQPVLRKL